MLLCGGCTHNRSTTRPTMIEPHTNSIFVTGMFATNAEMMEDAVTYLTIRWGGLLFVGCVCCAVGAVCVLCVLQREHAPLAC